MAKTEDTPKAGAEFDALVVALATANGHPDPHAYASQVSDILNAKPEAE